MRASEGGAPFARFIASLLPAIYKPFVQTPPPDLTHQQVRTLSLLDLDEPVCITELAARIGIKKSATSIMVSRLAARGFAWKERSTEDKRVVLVRLTPEGARIKDAPTAVDVERLEACLREEGIDWTIAFQNRLKHVVLVLRQAQTSPAATLRSPAMARAPC